MIFWMLNYTNMLAVYVFYFRLPFTEPKLTACNQRTCLGIRHHAFDTKIYSLLHANMDHQCVIFSCFPQYSAFIINLLSQSFCLYIPD